MEKKKIEKIKLSNNQEKLLEEFCEMWNRYKSNEYVFYSDKETYLIFWLISILEEYDYYMQKDIKNLYENLDFYGNKK